MSFKSIRDQVIAGVLLLVLTTTASFFGGLFTKTFYAVDPFQKWFDVNPPNYRTLHTRWKVIYPNKEFPDEIVTLNQKGAKIWGEGFDVKNSDNYVFTGKFTDKNYVTYDIKSSDARSNYQGVGIIKIDTEGKTASGYVIHLNGNPEKLTTTKFLLKAQI